MSRTIAPVKLPWLEEQYSVFINVYIPIYMNAVILHNQPELLQGSTVTHFVYGCCLVNITIAIKHSGIKSTTFRSLRTEFFKNRKNYSGQFYYGLVSIITDQIKCLKIADKNGVSEVQMLVL